MKALVCNIKMKFSKWFNLQKQTHKYNLNNNNHNHDGGFFVKTGNENGKSR